MAKLRANGRWHVPGSSGALANGWKVYTYIAGTSTNKNTYTDYLEGAANTNPVVLDARGEATIYWSGIYKVVVKDDDDVTVWTEDNYGEGETATQTGNFNLALNGSFETDDTTSGVPDNWTIVDYVTDASSLDATDQIHGLNSLKFVSTGSGGGYATSAYFEVREAKPISISWAMKSSVAGVRNVVDILWYTSAKTLISTTNLYDDSTTNPTSWTGKNYSSIPPSTARYAQIRIYGCHSSDPTSGTTWYDDVKVADAVNYKGTDVASATALILGAGNYFDVTGTTTITSITSVGIGVIVKLHFDGILTFTHHATNLILLGGNNITTYAGYEIELVEYASGDWRMVSSLPDQGTWTPAIHDTSFSDGEGQTYVVQAGHYTKIGNRVFINGQIEVNSIGTLTAGDAAHIGGLPFESISTSASGSVTFGQGDSLAVTAGQVVSGMVIASVSRINLRLWDATTGTSALLISEVSAGATLIFNGQYVVD